MYTFIYIYIYTHVCVCVSLREYLYGYQVSLIIYNISVVHQTNTHLLFSTTNTLTNHQTVRFK